MNKDYPFWKLLRAQWSWKNDRVMLGINLIFSLFINYCANLLLAEVTYTNTGLPVEGLELFYSILISTLVLWVFMSLGYQLLKLIIFTAYCSLLCYSLREKFYGDDGYLERVLTYNEALLRRQI